MKKSNNLKMERWINFKIILNNNKIIVEKKLGEKQGYFDYIFEM